MNTMRLAIILWAVSLGLTIYLGFERGWMVKDSLSLASALFAGWLAWFGFRHAKSKE